MIRWSRFLIFVISIPSFAQELNFCDEIQSSQDGIKAMSQVLQVSAGGRQTVEVYQEYLNHIDSGKDYKDFKHPSFQDTVSTMDRSVTSVHRYYKSFNLEPASKMVEDLESNYSPLMRAEIRRLSKDTSLADLRQATLALHGYSLYHADAVFSSSGKWKKELRDGEQWEEVRFHANEKRGGLSLPTSQELKIEDFIAFSPLPLFPIGIIEDEVIADGIKFDPRSFIDHDIEHIYDQGDQATYTPFSTNGPGMTPSKREKLFVDGYRCTCQAFHGLQTMPSDVQEAVKLIWFSATHELTYRNLNVRDPESLKTVFSGSGTTRFIKEKLFEFDRYFDGSLSHLVDSHLNSIETDKNFEDEILDRDIDLDKVNPRLSAHLEAARAWLMYRLSSLDSNCGSMKQEEQEQSEKKKDLASKLALVHALCEDSRMSKAGVLSGVKDLKGVSGALALEALKRVQQNFSKLTEVEQVSLIGQSLGALQKSNPNLWQSRLSQFQSQTSETRSLGTRAAGGLVVRSLGRLMSLPVTTAASILFSTSGRAEDYPENVEYYLNPSGFKELIAGEESDQKSRLEMVSGLEELVLELDSRLP